MMQNQNTLNLNINSLKLSLKWNSRQKATNALFVIEYESKLCVNA